MGEEIQRTTPVVTEEELGPEEFTIEQFEEMKEEADGVSSWGSQLFNAREIDREIAEETPCTRCEGKTEFDSIVNAGSYRAFAICRACGIAFEF